MLDIPKTVTIYRGFEEDRRTSIDIYSEHLQTYVTKLSNHRLKINDFQPSIPDCINILPHKMNIKMRAARYMVYPFHARKKQGDLNHIMEEGYGHLLYALDPSRTVVSVHDLIPILAWNNQVPGMSYPHRPRLAEISFSALKRARQIISVSHSTKNDLMRLCNVHSSKISVVYQGIDSDFHDVSVADKKTARQTLNLPTEGTHLVLITGQQEYKNHETCLQVIEQFQEISNKPVQLVRLGRLTREWQRQLEKARLKNKPICFQDLPRTMVIEVYKAVDCLLFPSLYEGFGRPPLEAMACWTPVVCSNRASLPEVVGSAGLLADANDVDDLVEKINILLTNRELYRDLSLKGKAHSSNFTWERAAEQVFNIYEEILSDVSIS